MQVSPHNPLVDEDGKLPQRLSHDESAGFNAPDGISRAFRESLHASHVLWLESLNSTMAVFEEEILMKIGELGIVG